MFTYDDDDYDAMLESRDERHQRFCELYDEEGEECLTVEERNPSLH
jgi:hypothetical protein